MHQSRVVNVKHRKNRLGVTVP